MEYSYDHVFGEQDTTKTIYQTLIHDKMGAILKDGKNGTVFMYGQTCSGKTFTMNGGGEEEEVDGILPLAVKVRHGIKWRCYGLWTRVSSYEDLTIQVVVISVQSRLFRIYLTKSNEKNVVPTIMSLSYPRLLSKCLTWKSTTKTYGIYSHSPTIQVKWHDMHSAFERTREDPLWSRI